MERKVVRWLCVNVFDIWGLLSSVSAKFLVFEIQVGALHAELAVEGEQRCVRSRCLQRTYLFIISPLAACLLLQTSMSSALSFLCAIYAISAHACVLRIGGLCYLCGISVIYLCYLCYLALGLMFALCYLCAATLCWGLFCI